MRLVCLVLIVFFLLCPLSSAAKDDGGESVSFEEYSLSLGDRVLIGDYRVELVDIQSVRDGLSVIRVTKSGGALDEQRVLLENNENNFDGGADDGGLTITVVDIFDETSAKIRLEYPSDLGQPRKRSAEHAPTKAMPNLGLIKTFDNLNLSVGDEVRVTVSVKNFGIDDALDIQVYDQPPLPDFVYKAGYPPKIKSQLGPGESDSAIYIINGVREGKIEVPPIDVTYKDKNKNIKSNSSVGFTVTINPIRKPNLQLQIDPIAPIPYGSTALLNLTLRNKGQAPAYRVEIGHEIMPSEGLRVVKGSLDDSYFEIPSGRMERISAELKGERSGNYTLRFKVGYQSGEDMLIKETATEVSVLEQDYKYLYYLLLLPVLLIAAWIIRRYKEYRY